jgi:glutathione S-transferase
MANEDHRHALHLRPHQRADRPGLRPRRADRVRDRDDALRRLFTIPISHYCEKARWALERAGLAYDEERHVQGVHRFASRRAGGVGTLPVLLTDEGVFKQSEWIVRYADLHLPPEQRLFRSDGETAFCRWLDAGLGPDGRRLMYSRMLPLKDLLLPFNNAGVPRWEAAFLRLAYPVVGAWARHELRISGDDAPLVFAAFDAVAERLADKPFLFGERFGAADLTFACLAASVVVPPEYGVALPQPDALPADVAEAVRGFRAHPAGAFALRCFRELRHSPAGA